MLCLQKKTIAKAPAKKSAAAKKPAAAKKTAASKKSAATKKPAAKGAKAMLYAPAEGSDLDVKARIKAAMAILKDEPISAIKAEAAAGLLEGVLKVL